MMDIIERELNDTIVKLGIEKLKLKLLLKRYRNILSYNEEKKLEEIFEQLTKVETNIMKIVEARNDHHA